MFSEKDLAQLQQHGLDTQTVEQQIRYFQQGFPFMQLIRAATPGDATGQVTQTLEVSGSTPADWEDLAASQHQGQPTLYVCLLYTSPSPRD